MSALRAALQFTSKARTPSGAKLITPANALLRRNLRSTACRKEQFFDADKATFEKAISKEGSKDKVVLVDFYADWCGPCKMLSPILEKLTSAENAQSVKTGSGRALDLVTINTDEEGELAAQYQVSSLPTVIAFKDGEPVHKFIGALPEKGVSGFIAAL